MNIELFKNFINRPKNSQYRFFFLVLFIFRKKEKEHKYFMSRNIIAKPFLKWAGGKSQLIEKFNTLYPLELYSGAIETYVEPFVGGGAVLFDVVQRFDNIKKAIVFDLNKELINCYRCIQVDVTRLINILKSLQKTFIDLSIDDRLEFYLSIRGSYNLVKLNGEYDFEKASKFIFLNKTCFNGLYRVNSKGEFNVPFGKYKNPLICDEPNLLLINKLLQKVEVHHGDYSESKKYIHDGTMVYFDPPYRPITQTSAFVGYSQNGFNDDDQKTLSEFVKSINTSGIKIMLSNSDPKNSDPNDSFFDDLYKDFDIQRISARRIINCQAEKRGNIAEIVVRNYIGDAK